MAQQKRYELTKNLTVLTKNKFEEKHFFFELSSDRPDNLLHVNLAILARETNDVAGDISSSHYQRLGYSVVFSV